MCYFYGSICMLLAATVAAQTSSRNPLWETEFHASFLLIHPILTANNLENSPDLYWGSRLALIKARPIGDQLFFHTGLSLLIMQLRQQYEDINLEGEVFRIVRPSAGVLSLGVPLNFTYHPFRNKFFVRGGGQVFWNFGRAKTADVTPAGTPFPIFGRPDPFIPGEFAIAPFMLTLDAAIGFREPTSDGGYYFMELGISRSLGNLVEYSQNDAFGTLRYMDDAAVLMPQLTVGGTFSKNKKKKQR